MIDEHAHARASDPETSHEAAASVDVPELEMRVFESLCEHRDCGGMTTTEIGIFLRLPRDSISPRIAPLVRKGLVRDSGAKRLGLSRRRQIVWIANL